MKCVKKRHNIRQNWNQLNAINILRISINNQLVTVNMYRLECKCNKFNMNLRARMLNSYMYNLDMIVKLAMYAT